MFKPGDKVLVRTFSAGVHYGAFHSLQDKQMILQNCQRIWQWQGANTLHELSLKGLDHASKVSEPIPFIMLTEVIEVLPCSEEAINKIESAGWGKSRAK